jgi:hypothetical protein
LAIDRKSHSVDSYAVPKELDNPTDDRIVDLKPGPIPI